MAHPTLEGIPIKLGDILQGPPMGTMDAGRVRGWSPDGTIILVGWLGAVPLAQCRWCQDLAIAAFPKLYRVAQENRWPHQ